MWYILDIIPWARTQKGFMKWLSPSKARTRISGGGTLFQWNLNPAARLQKTSVWGLGGCDPPTSPNLEKGTLAVHDNLGFLISPLGAQPGKISNLAIQTLVALPPIWQEASRHWPC